MGPARVRRRLLAWAIWPGKSKIQEGQRASKRSRPGLADGRPACSIRAMAGIHASVQAYETWLARALGDALVPDDLKAKRKKMKESPFLFLRATCWRWAELAGELCPDLVEAPRIASVGDAHVGNFGLWRDGEGRLVWGVNDYDEAAVTAWPLDLVRLAASALLADDRLSAREVASVILEGYGEGLARPAAAVLERDGLWLRDLFAADDRKRLKEWKQLLGAKAAKAPPPARFRAALAAASPADAPKPRFAPRVAGAGSLGRMRIVASLEEYRGGPLAREAKALVPSCWNRKAAPGALQGLAGGRYRAPDPWLRLHGEVIVRRLSPNSRKLEFAEHPERGRARLLQAMARDIAAIHAADTKRLSALRADLNERKAGWLRAAARKVAAATEREWKAWKG